MGQPFLKCHDDERVIVENPRVRKLSNHSAAKLATGKNDAGIQTRKYILYVFKTHDDDNIHVIHTHFP